jgi:Asp-tRNA(Asn)/Glu-tRNA(Gln) amidotransferase A subunit family amidase
MPELTSTSAVDLASMMREKRVSPVEVAEAYLHRIDEQNPRLNAFVHVEPERVLREARKAEAAIQRGESTGPLHGVPLSIKSSIDVAGYRCEAGTKLRAGYIAARDAVLVDRLRAAGAIILGVTNCPELLMAWETDNVLYGRTNNPWDVSRTAGGSSGGESAAIAAGMSAGGVGSDGGGSIREPAHFCGICGLKPTPGRIPALGHFPICAGPFAQLGVVGPMARTVADLRLLFEVMSGYDDADVSSVAVALRLPQGKSAQEHSIGYFEDDGRTPVTPETRAAVRAAAEALGQAGFRTAPFRPENLELARDLWWKFFGVAGGMLLGPMVKGHEQDLSPQLRQFLGWVAAEPTHTGHTLLYTWLQRDELRTQFLAQMRVFSVLVCPVAAIPAFRHGERNWQVEGHNVKYLDAWSYTEWFNLLGLPACVVPVGRSPEGLPIGVQIVGRPWEEDLVLQVAAAIEARTSGYQPPQLRPRDLVAP